MKIAFIAQPIDSVIPPIQNSIGIIIYEFAKRISEANDITIFMNKTHNNRNCYLKDNIKFISLNTFVDKFINKINRKISKYRDKRLSPHYSTILHYISYCMQAARKIKKDKFDIVHIVNFSQFIPIIRAINPKVKIVIHMECEWLNQLNYEIIKNRIRKVDLIIGCSEYITQKIRKKFPESKNICTTLYNGVNFVKLEVYEKKTDKKNSTKLLLFVGRLSPEKGVHILINAFKKVYECNKNIKLILIGPHSSAPAEYIVNISDDPKVKKLASYYESGYQDILEKQSLEHINKDIFFINSLPYKELVSYYCESDIFVFPSVWHEPFGMPVIEAMACGKPVIATKSGGISELVEDGHSGLLVDRDDADALSNAILRILNDENLIRSMGKEGRKRVFEKYTWDKIADGLTSLYHKII